jgi:hypothetical protein
MNTCRAPAPLQLKNNIGSDDGFDHKNANWQLLILLVLLLLLLLLLVLLPLLALLLLPKVVKKADASRRVVGKDLSGNMEGVNRTIVT